MKKIIFIIVLFSIYAAYSGWVYTSGTECDIAMPVAAREGKQLWQRNNCQSCHQIFGLGGYMGPDLTLVTADNRGGGAYVKAMLLSGGYRMPNFHFSEAEADKLVAFLLYVNTTSVALTK